MAGLGPILFGWLHAMSGAWALPLLVPLFGAAVQFVVPRTTEQNVPCRIAGNLVVELRPIDVLDVTDDIARRVSGIERIVLKIDGNS